MPEAIDSVRELGDDVGIDGDVVRLELIDVRLDAAREVLEDEVLVLHFGCEPRRLEQVFAIPFALLNAIGQIRPRKEPLAHKGRIVVHLGQDHLLQVPDQPVVFRVEDVMDGGQADVLVSAPIAGDVMSIEQLIIVIAARIRAVEIPEADLGIAVRDLAGRNGIVRDVVQEGMSGAGRASGADGMGRVAFDEGECRHGHRELGISIGSALEAPVRVDLRRGMSVTSASVKSMPSRSLACALTSAHVVRPPLSPSRSRPVAIGRPVSSRAYSRRKT